MSLTSDHLSVCVDNSVFYSAGAVVFLLSGDRRERRHPETPALSRRQRPEVDVRVKGNR
ncbi:MAG TPA: hypothetical protein VIA80_14870 [Hyphomonadaceae bacterium]